MKIAKTNVILLIMTLLLASCSSLQYDAKKEKRATQESLDKEIQAIDAGDDWATTKTVDIEYHPISIKWLSSFHDPILLKLIEEGKSNNKTLKIAAANVEKAWLLAGQAGAGLKPSLDLALGGARSDTGSNAASTTDLNINLQAGWEADIWGRIRAGYDAGVASAQGVNADYIFAQHSLSAGIAKGYLLAIEAGLQAGATQANISLLEKILEIAEFKYKNGVVSLQDVALTRSDLAAAKENLAEIQGAHRNALRALEVLIGRYPNAALELPETLPELPPAPSAGIPSEILERRPDIVAAERKVAAAFNLTARAKAARLPRLSLTGSFGGASDELSSILNPANIAWQLAGNLLMPVFDGGSRRREVDIVTLEQEQALLTFAETALDAFSEVEQNLDQGQVLLKREKALKEVKQEIDKAYRIAGLRYAEGESELIDVLNIQQRLTRADSNLIATQRALLEQRINLYLALGGEW